MFGARWNKMERDAIDLGRLHVGYLFRRLFIPTLLGMLGMSAVTVVDGVFVGHGVGSDGIAAVNLCIPLLMLFTGAGLMAGAGCSVVASIHFARRKYKAARINVTQAMLFVTLLAALPVALILAFPRQVALLLGSSRHLLPQVVDYLVWFVPGLIPQLWIAVGLYVIRLDGAPRLAMWCSLLSAAANVVLDYLFIFPFGWGVMGAALASTISILLGGAIVLRYLLRGARTLRLYPLKRSRKSLRLMWRNIGYQCRIGSSALLGEATMAVLMFTGNRVFMHYLGDAGVGAFGVACYYMPFIFMIGNAIAQSAQPIISYNYGAKNADRVKAAFRLLLKCNLCYSVMLWLLVMIFPQVFAGLFTADPTLLAYTKPALRIYLACLGLFGIQLACQMTFTSLGKALDSIVVAVMRKFILLIPLIYLMPRLFPENRAMAVYLAEPAADFFAILFTSILFTSEFKRALKKMRQE